MKVEMYSLKGLFRGVRSHNAALVFPLCRETPARTELRVTILRLTVVMVGSVVHSVEVSVVVRNCHWRRGGVAPRSLLQLYKIPVYTRVQHDR